MPAKILFFSLVFGISSLAVACGEYRVQAWVRKVNADFYLVLNEKTQSELRLKVPFKQDTPLYGHLNQFISADVIIRQKLDGTAGIIDQVMAAKLSRPVQWVEGRSGSLKLVKSQVCQPASSP